MKVPPQHTRQLSFVATILALTTLISLSAAPFKTSAAGGATTNFRTTAVALSYAAPSVVIPNSGTANDMIYDLPGGDGNNLAILEDDGTPGNGMSQLGSGNGSFDSVVFANPANTLTINASNDGEKIAVNNMDSGFVAKINLEGGTSIDTFALGDGATLKGGSIRGGGDTLDYSAYTTPVWANLAPEEQRAVLLPCAR
jgi:hypothetical protein